MLRRTVVVIVVVLVAPSRAIAAVRTSTTDEANEASGTDAIEEVEVSAKREPAPSIADPTATTTRIGEERLDLARARAEEIADVVGGVPGARVLELGGPVSEKRLLLRGGTAAEALLVIDGAVVRSPFATGLDLGLLDVETIEMIDVVRGGAGAALGEGALTGALVLTTRPPRATYEEAFALTYGAFDTTRISASARGGAISAGASFARTEGDFAYVSRISGLPDREAVRTNADAARGALAVALDEDASFGRVRVRAGGGLREGGVPGLETQPQPYARERRGNAQVHASLSSKREGSARAPRFSLSLQSSLLDIRYDDDDPRPTHAPRHEATTFVTFGGDLEGSTPIASAHRARATIGAGIEQSDSSVHGTPRRFRGSFGASDEAVVGPLLVYAAVRAEGLTGESLALLPRAGAKLEVVRDLSLTLAAGRSWRAPRIDELYHPSEPGFSGNPELRAETAWEAEASIAYGERGDRASARATGFARAIDDAILYVNRNAFEVRPENLGSSRALGLELEAQAAGSILFDARASIDGALTLLAAELEATKERPPSEPAWSAGGRVEISRGPWSASSALMVFGETSANLQATLEVPRYLRWDAALTVRPLDGAELALSVLNLLDDRTLESLQKVPLPGRAIFFTVRVTSPASDGGAT